MRISWFAVVLLFGRALYPQAAQVPRLSDLRFGVGVQITGVYTQGTLADINNDGKLEPVDDRFDIGLRRGRFSVAGALGTNMDFRVVFYFDNIGRDRYTGTRGTPGEGNAGIWDAFWNWHASPRWANVTIGYFRPQIGRETMTSGFQTNSNMDKLPTQNYLRFHMLGRSNGRETGINLGGQATRSKWTINYNGGFFDTSHEGVTGQAYGGAKWSPLLVGRGSISYGDPEMRSHGIDYVINYFGRRKGITAALAFARQGETNVFRNNETVNFDVLANYKHLNFDAELDVLRREPHTRPRYSDKVWHVRAGYNVPVRNTFLEPVIACMRFRGDHSSPYADGRDELVDVGLNWYVRETRVKFNVHYTNQTGRPVSGYTDGKTFLRGDMVGFGLQFVY